MVKGIGEVVLEHYPEFIDGAIDSIDYWLDALDELGVHIKELDESLWARLESIYELDYSVETWKDAFSSPRHVQNALTAMLMAMGESDSGIAWGLAAAEGLMSAAPKLQEAIREGLAARGIEVERPMDLIRGAGMLFAGMSQNRASLESGGTGKVGIPSIIGGIMSMTGIGGSMAGIVVSILSNIFKERKLPEAEQIGNVRHFIDSGSGLFDAQERFYMSGRHAALARPERVAGDDLSSLESATMGGFAQSVYQDHSSTQNTFEININGAQDPQAVAQEVRRELERYTSNYGRQLKRGLRG